MFRILIAEDEEPIANLIRMNLTKAGICVPGRRMEKARQILWNGRSMTWHC